MALTKQRYMFCERHLPSTSSPTAPVFKKQHWYSFLFCDLNTSPVICQAASPGTGNPQPERTKLQRESSHCRISQPQHGPAFKKVHRGLHIHFLHFQINILPAEPKSSLESSNKTQVSYMVCCIHLRVLPFCCHCCSTNKTDNTSQQDFHKSPR